MTVSRLAIKENYPLRALTTLKIGGAARYFTEVSQEYDVLEALEFAKSRNLEIFTLGSGSNILISDEGFTGLVVHNKLTGLASRRNGDSVIVTAKAGHDWDTFAKFCTEHNLQGVECLSGIPGTVGAAPVQNIGAYGQSAENVVEEVRAIDINTGAQVILDKRECGFGYRKSIFNTTAVGRYIITGVVFRLASSGYTHLTHHDLKRYFSSTGNITPAQVREAVIEIRNSKGLLVLDGYERLNSAGSFFKNPVVPHALFKCIDKTVRDMGGCENWYWLSTSGEVKISAACLIQTAGFIRGYRSGNVGISPWHTLALINYGDATAREVITFARHIQERVREKFGITLKPEVQRIGIQSPDLLNDG
ncbi:MAG TPA: UDP-N-acetylmuramate dehydrogenase [Dissulfurispiraceae bacterium]|nr:UDP-N-acetylmuramate dehydrogenase [Dissulfurispiraceae bacterium]